MHIGRPKGPRKISAALLLDLNEDMVADGLESWRRAVPSSLKHITNLGQLVSRLSLTLHATSHNVIWDRQAI